MTPEEAKTLADSLLQNRGAMKDLLDSDLVERYDKFGTFPDTQEPLVHMYRQIGQDAQKVLDGRKADSQFERVLRQGRISARIAMVAAGFAAIGAATAFVPTLLPHKSKAPHTQLTPPQTPPDSQPATSDPKPQTPHVDAPTPEPKSEPAIDPSPQTPKLQ